MDGTERRCLAPLTRSPEPRGWRAIYLHTGDADIATPEYTTDADLAVEPSTLAREPNVAEALVGAGFHVDAQPGIWIREQRIDGRAVRSQVDLLVPDAIAGPAALLVAKLHKIRDRAEGGRRSKDKDALDVLRLLRAVSTPELAVGLRGLLASALAAAVTATALVALDELFGRMNATGAVMAARAAPQESAEVIAASAAALASDLVDELRIAG